MPYYILAFITSKKHTQIFTIFPYFGLGPTGYTWLYLPHLQGGGFWTHEMCKFALITLGCNFPLLEGFVLYILYKYLCVGWRRLKTYIFTGLWGNPPPPPNSWREAGQNRRFPLRTLPVRWKQGSTLTEHIKDARAACVGTGTVLEQGLLYIYMSEQDPCWNKGWYIYMQGQERCWNQGWYICM